MFLGNSQVTMDARGRIAMPTRFRDTIRERSDGSLVITIDRRDRCLLLYPAPDWANVESQLRGLPNTHSQIRNLQRLLIGFASPVDLDGNGRVLIPPRLREYAELKKGVYVVGQSNKLELWSVDNWDGNVDNWLEEGNRAVDDLEIEGGLLI